MSAPQCDAGDVWRSSNTSGARAMPPATIRPVGNYPTRSLTSQLSSWVRLTQRWCSPRVRTRTAACVAVRSDDVISHHNAALRTHSLTLEQGGRCAQAGKGKKGGRGRMARLVIPTSAGGIAACATLFVIVVLVMMFGLYELGA
jgi:hypothetical protein